MKHNCSSKATESVTIEVENLTREDAQFIRCVVALFTDPNFKAVLEDIRGRHSMILYAPRGYARVCANFSNN